MRLFSLKNFFHVCGRCLSIVIAKSKASFHILSNQPYTINECKIQYCHNAKNYRAICSESPYQRGLTQISDEQNF